MLRLKPLALAATLAALAAPAPASAHVPLPGEVADAQRLTLADVFTNAGIPMKLVLFGLALSVVAILLVWTLQLLRRSEAPNGGLAYLSGVAAAAPLFGFFGAFYAILSGCIGIANVRPTPSLTVLAPGLAEASLSAGLGLLAAALAVTAAHHLNGARLRAASRRGFAAAGPRSSSGDLRAAA